MAEAHKQIIKSGQMWQQLLDGHSLSRRRINAKVDPALALYAVVQYLLFHISFLCNKLWPSGKHKVNNAIKPAKKGKKNPVTFHKNN